MTKDEKEGGKKHYGKYMTILPAESDTKNTMNLIGEAAKILANRFADNRYDIDYDTLTIRTTKTPFDLTIGIKFEGWRKDDEFTTGGQGRSEKDH